MKILQNYLFRSLLKIFGAFFLLILIVSFLLRLYTAHNRNIATPNFVGMPFEKASKLAKKKGLSLVIIDSVYESSYKGGYIIDQTPKAKFPVKKRRKIFVVIKAYMPQMVQVPKVVDYSLVQAQALLEAKGLFVGKVEYIINPNFDNLVVGQYYNGKPIAEGQKIQKGSKIDLVVYSKIGKTVTVPDLTGLNYSEVIRVLSSNNLNLGNVYYSKDIKTAVDSAEAIVFKQTPSENKSVSIGTSIDIWLMKVD